MNHPEYVLPEGVAKPVDYKIELAEKIDNPQKAYVDAKATLIGNAYVQSIYIAVKEVTENYITLRIARAGNGVLRYDLSLCIVEFY